MTTDEKKEDTPSYLEYVRVYKEQIKPSSLPASVQIEEAFDEIIILQSMGISIEQLVADMNKDGLKVSLSYFKTIMNRIRAKRKKQKQKDQPAAQSSAAPATAPVIEKPTATQPPEDVLDPVKAVAVVPPAPVTGIQRAPETSKRPNPQATRERMAAEFDRERL